MFAPEQDGPVSVSPEQGSAFTVALSATQAVRLTFLAPTMMRIQVLPSTPAANILARYVHVTQDSAYLPVEVAVHREADEATFETAAAFLTIARGGDVISLALRSRNNVLIDEWEIDADERVARIELKPDERIYGFGDKRAGLDQRGQRVDMINLDAFASESNNSYKSVPFYLSSVGYGLFFNNYHPGKYDVGASLADWLQIEASGGDMDFYAFVGDMKEILAHYTELTGRPAMLPLWAFGYHQGKASYRGREGLDVAAQMRQRQLPFDVIYYDDFDHEAIQKAFIDELWNRYRARLTVGFGMPMFGTWRGNDDSILVRELAARGYLMVDRENRPVIARSEYVESDDGDTSSVAYLDYFSKAAVDYVFSVKWDKAIENGAILGMVDFGEMDHVQGDEQKFWPSVGLSVAQTRNLFGLVYPLAVVSGVHDRAGGRSTGMVRPGFAGSQRLGWTTTGDSLPTYRNFRAHIRAMLNLTLSGFSNVGQDIGGWDSKAEAILYARWFAAATFFPFMWSHGKQDHEPYSHGDVVERAARTFLNLRYRLIPYLYSAHEAAHRTGVPVVRAFALQEPADPAGVGIDDQFFVGDDILVAPLFNDNGERNLYLPKGLWYDFFGEQRPVLGGRVIERKSVPLHRLPVYVRGGAIIPLGPAMQHTGEKPIDPLSVHIYGFATADRAQSAALSAASLYEDDGTSLAYRDGKFQRTHFKFHQSRHSVRLEVETESGDQKYRSVPSRAFHLYFHGIEAPVSSVRIDGQEISQSEAPDPAADAASWSMNESSGGVSVFIPASSVRAFLVDFSIDHRPASVGIGSPASQQSSR
jgi:alpha-glucosidase (family GH31 glycosyl hydrolase)